MVVGDTLFDHLIGVLTDFFTDARDADARMARLTESVRYRFSEFQFSSAMTVIPTASIRRQIRQQQRKYRLFVAEDATSVVLSIHYRLPLLLADETLRAKESIIAADNPSFRMLWLPEYSVALPFPYQP